jgi:hypothetical protein
MIELLELSKQELKSKLGEESFWKAKPVLGCLGYVSGIIAFDSLPHSPPSRKQLLSADQWV